MAGYDGVFLVPVYRATLALMEVNHTASWEKISNQELYHYLPGCLTGCLVYSIKGSRCCCLGNYSVPLNPVYPLYLLSFP